MEDKGSYSQGCCLFVEILIYLFGCYQVFLGGAAGKQSSCQFRRHKRFWFDPWVGKITWRRKWQPIPVFLPGKSHGQRSLSGYSPWACKDSDMTEPSMHTHTHTHTPQVLVSACGVPWTGIRLMPPALGAQSLRHWAAGVVPSQVWHHLGLVSFFVSVMSSLLFWYRGGVGLWDLGSASGDRGHFHTCKCVPWS